MDDSGVDSINLKTFMQQGKATLPMAEQIGSAIGEFIGEMHKWGRGNAEVLDAVRGNEQAKTMSAWLYYGRLVSTLKGLEEDGLPIPKLSSPSLEIEGSDMEVVEKVVEETTKAMLEVQDSVSHGKLSLKTYFYLEFIVCNGRFLARQYHGISQQERRVRTPLYPRLGNYESWSTGYRNRTILCGDPYA
jgi:hypothetical protein